MDKYYAGSIYKDGLRSVATLPEPVGQKFHIGTFVRIADDLGESMKHFDKSKFAKVQYTYAHAFGGNDVKSYSLLVRYSDNNWSSVAWYYEHQLTLVTDVNLINQFKGELSKSNKSRRMISEETRDNIKDFFFRFKLIRDLFLNKEVEELNIHWDMILFGEAAYHLYKDGTRRHVPRSKLIKNDPEKTNQNL